MTRIRHAYGVVRHGDRSFVAARLGDRVHDLSAVDGLAPALFSTASLGPLLALGPAGWDDVHHAVAEHLIEEPPGLPADQVTTGLPVRVGDYVDFYASEHHAAHLGRLFRPDDEPLLPNWRHLPIAYHGRAGSLVPSGTPVRRPSGVLGPGRRGPSERLDLEVEVGFLVGADVPMGTALMPDDAAEVVFGIQLVNDWSARDIQAFEYRPLGPFAGKSFATSVSPWVTPIAALSLVSPPPQSPAPDPALVARGAWGIDLALDWSIGDTVLGRANAAELYWTFAQMAAHLTLNGAGLRRGDLFASGTVSGPDPGQAGSLIEAAENGSSPVVLRDGSTRTWLEDGDTVTIRGTSGDVTVGSVTATVLSATEEE